MSLAFLSWGFSFLIHWNSEWRAPFRGCPVPSCLLCNKETSAVAMWIEMGGSLPGKQSGVISEKSWFNSHWKWETQVTAVFRMCVSYTWIQGVLAPCLGRPSVFCYSFHFWDVWLQLIALWVLAKGEENCVFQASQSKSVCHFIRILNEMRDTTLRESLGEGYLIKN